MRKENKDTEFNCGYKLGYFAGYRDGASHGEGPGGLHDFEFEREHKLGYLAGWQDAITLFYRYILDCPGFAELPYKAAAHIYMTCLKFTEDIEAWVNDDTRKDSPFFIV